MNYQEFRKLQAEKMPFVKQVVDQAHKSIDSGSFLLSDVKKSLRLSDKEALAFITNTSALRNVKRKTGEPYSTHPTRAALVAKELLGDRLQDEIEIILMHDYLEEGIGVSVENYKSELKLNPSLEKGLFGALVLTEPMLDYQQMGGEKRLLQYVAYVEVIGALKNKLSQDYFNALMFDKLDNIQDWSYIIKNDKYSGNRVSYKLHQKMVYYDYILEHLGPFALSELSLILKEAIEYWKSSLGLDGSKIEIHQEAFIQAKETVSVKYNSMLFDYIKSLRQ